ncbi:hypothetical protein NX059_002500 [Plenodomus lindquistii]|nr:hypothetical protein NX059_002500 [Plenodomus lindquistii]
MIRSTSFLAAINIPYGEHGRIVTDRIARTRSRHALELQREDKRAENRVAKYRATMLEELYKLALDSADTEGAHEALQLVQKFMRLAITLADSKALAFPHEISKALQVFESSSFSARDEQSAVSEKSEVKVGDNADVVKFDSDRNQQCQAPVEDVELFTISASYKSEGTSTAVSHHLRESTTHPLSIALLAYHFGGPVNAAHTARKHWWRCSPKSLTSVDEFHIEGGTCEALNDVRVTVVWEEHGQTSTRPSGQHNVFLTGDATPFSLITSTTDDENGSVSPLTIIYDSRAATLYYDCQNPEVKRHSVSLDFHLNTITDDTLQLLSAELDKQDTEQPTLTTLVTNFPVANYTAHFQRHLYDKDNVTAILRKLLSLRVPVAPPTTDQSKHQLVLRFQDYNNDNVNRIPYAISSMPFDIPLAGSYPYPTSFLDSVCIKAQSDIHRPIGHSLFPQNAIDGRREDARKFIRDLSEELISSQLANYANALVSDPYTSSDLLETSTIHELAKRMERRCLELVASGFVDIVVDMSSMAALASALGAAIDGVKEIHITLEPWFEEMDLLMFRTRCLYLFWCVDWFVCYLVNPAEGAFMLLDAEKLSGHFVTARREMIQTAHLLLRNWVAWGMFMESLPQRGFFVRQSAGVGRTNLGSRFVKSRSNAKVAEKSNIGEVVRPKKSPIV